MWNGYVRLLEVPVENANNQSCECLPVPSRLSLHGFSTFIIYFLFKVDSQQPQGRRSIIIKNSYTISNIVGYDMINYTSLTHQHNNK